MEPASRSFACACGKTFNSSSAHQRHVAADCAQRPHRRRKITHLPAFELQLGQEGSAPLPDPGSLPLPNDLQQQALEQNDPSESSPTDPATNPAPQPAPHPTPAQDLQPGDEGPSSSSGNTSDADGDLDGAKWAELEARLISAAADLHLDVDADWVHAAFQQLQLQLRQALQQDVGECSAWLALAGHFLQVTYMLHLQQWQQSAMAGQDSNSQQQQLAVLQVHLSTSFTQGDLLSAPSPAIQTFLTRRRTSLTHFRAPWMVTMKSRWDHSRPGRGGGQAAHCMQAAQLLLASNRGTSWVAFRCEPYQKPVSCELVLTRGPPCCIAGF